MGGTVQPNKFFPTTSQVEPPELETELYCACCPKKVGLLTRSYQSPEAPTETYLELSPGRHRPLYLKEFLQGLLVILKQQTEPKVHDGHVYLVHQPLKIYTTPHQRTAYRLPTFGFAVDQPLWICQRCKDEFHAHLPEIEAYLARRSHDYRLRFLGN